MLQLDPPIWLNTPKGDGLCHIVLDYGPEFAIQWVVFINETGECWTYSNEDIRACKNVTNYRPNPTRLDTEKEQNATK